MQPHPCNWSLRPEVSPCGLVGSVKTDSNRVLTSPLDLTSADQATNPRLTPPSPGVLKRHPGHTTRAAVTSLDQLASVPLLGLKLTMYCVLDLFVFLFCDGTAGC